MIVHGRIHVLLIEDSPSDAVIIRHVLQDNPMHATFETQTATSLARGLLGLRSGTFDVVLLDLNLPDSDGIDTFNAIQSAFPDVPVVILTSSGGEDLAQRIVDHGAQDFLFKNRIDPYWVAQTLKHAIHRHHLRQRIKAVEAREVELAHRANKAKTEFLAAMSHEIRTPIGTILMAADLLLADSTDASERLELTGLIYRNGEHLLKLISDFLDISKIEAGCLSVVQETTLLGPLVSDVVESFAPLAKKKGLDLILEMGMQAPDALTTDVTRFRQVLSNLLGNAIKFTEIGGVTVRVKAPEAGSIVFEVEDSGIGIDETARLNLFLPYAQADATVAKRFGGTGLGLVLSRRLATALGGSLELTWSEPGRGSRFTLTLPSSARDADSARRPRGLEPETPRTLHGARVLVVDDNADTRHLVSTALRHGGADVVEAEDGVEGLDVAMSQHFDVVLMDMQMPRMRGDEAARELRNRGYGQPIIALSADRFALDNAVGTGGCNQYLLKPIAPRQLIQTVHDAYSPGQ